MVANIASNTRDSCARKLNIALGWSGDVAVGWEFHQVPTEIIIDARYRARRVNELSAPELLNCEMQDISELMSILQQVPILVHFLAYWLLQEEIHFR